MSGPQYRSVIFYHNEAQRKAALKSYRDLTAARAYRAPIVTQLLPMKAFYRAEDYHQNYYGGKDDRPVGRTSRSRRTAEAGRRRRPRRRRPRRAVAKKGTAVAEARPRRATSRHCRRTSGGRRADAEP